MGQNTEVVLPDTDVPLSLDLLNAQLASELAAGLSDVDSLCAKYGISEAQWKVLRVNPVFRNMVAEAIRVWRGDLNAGQRITKKAELVLEDAIPVLDEIAHSNSTAPAVRIEAIKQMESITGRKAKAEGKGGDGTGFTLNINIGDGKRPITIEGTPLLETTNE